MAECIHGFDEGMCAICFPAPEPQSPPSRPGQDASRPSSTRSPRRSTRPARVAGHSRPDDRGKSPRDIGEHRLYHVTHLNNLPSILDSGALLPFEDIGDSAVPFVDIASPEHRAARRNVTIDDARLTTMVPFLFSPDARIWLSLRSRRPDSRLSDTSTSHPPTEFIMLVAAVNAFRPRTDVGEGGTYLVSDREASDPSARVAADDGDARRLLSRLLTADDIDASDAEVLVPGPVPLDRIAIVGVANEKVRDLVRDALRTAGYSTRVAVHPPWFRSAQ